MADVIIYIDDRSNGDMLTCEIKSKFQTDNRCIFDSVCDVHNSIFSQ